MSGGPVAIAARMRPYWSVLRARWPHRTARVEAQFRATRGRAALAAEVQAMRDRMHAVERDHALLAAYVAALTNDFESTRRSLASPTHAVAAPATVDPAAQSAQSDALVAARLSAISFYEHRIARLERATGSRRKQARKEAEHAEPAMDPGNTGPTSAVLEANAG